MTQQMLKFQVTDSSFAPATFAESLQVFIHGCRSVSSLSATLKTLFAKRWIRQAFRKFTFQRYCQKMLMKQLAAGTITAQIYFACRIEEALTIY
jgi:hypothetical protein